MLNEMIKLFFKKKRVSKVTKLSNEDRIFTENILKEKPQMNCGIFRDLREREKFYQKLFSVCNQL